VRFILAYAGVPPVAEVTVECTESFFRGLCFGRGVCSRSHLPAVMASRNEMVQFDEVKGSANKLARADQLRNRLVVPDRPKFTNAPAR
jgi:hypothetical protein